MMQFKEGFLVDIVVWSLVFCAIHFTPDRWMNCLKEQRADQVWRDSKGQPVNVEKMKVRKR